MYYFSDSDKTPSWFYIVRVQQKSPCAVIHVAFLGGTPGKLRNQVSFYLGVVLQ